MIYHKWKLIFVGIPKNASTSIHLALKNRTDYYSEGHKHDTIFDEYNQHDEDVLLHYDSMCVVRNPYDRFYSAWKFNHPHPGPTTEEQFKSSFNTFVKKMDSSNKINLDLSHHHYWPQYKFVTLNKRIVVDHVLRYESLQNDWVIFQKEWNERRKLPYCMNLYLPFENCSQIKTKWQDIYEPQSLQIVYNHYHTDFEIFNYSK
jgi:hypothetical protein